MAAVTSNVTTIGQSHQHGLRAAGVAPVNGLRWVLPTAGHVAKPSNQIWSFNGENNGVAPAGAACTREQHGRLRRCSVARRGIRA